MGVYKILVDGQPRETVEADSPSEALERARELLADWLADASADAAADVTGRGALVVHWEALGECDDPDCDDPDCDDWEATTWHVGVERPEPDCEHEDGHAWYQDGPTWAHGGLTYVTTYVCKWCDWLRVEASGEDCSCCGEQGAADTVDYQRSYR